MAADRPRNRGPVRSEYFDCYMVVDVHSRFIVGAWPRQRIRHAYGEMINEIFGIHGIPTVVHADRGTSM